MTGRFTPIIGLEVHAELLTRTKMFCGCQVVDTAETEPNSSICPVCTGMPGALPVINRQAVEHGLRVALALGCTIAPFSLFARKNYFYPDLPKGFQISQYEYPMATGGGLTVATSEGEETIQLRRIHLEEDTGKLSHFSDSQGKYSLVDLNRAGVPLLEIVTEPVLRSLESVKAYSMGLRAILKYLKACSGDMEKGALRFEANISIMRSGDQEFGKRVEIKNLNSFRAMEKAIKFEMDRQAEVLSRGGTVNQETVGWDEINERTISQRSKEEAHDYRYFSEPDLPPLTVEESWLDTLRVGLPELPYAKKVRFLRTYGLSDYLADLLCIDPDVADFFEHTVQFKAPITPQQVANWITGDIFAYANQNNLSFGDIFISPGGLSFIIDQVENEKISRANGRQVLNEVLATGKQPEQLIQDHGYEIVNDESALLALVVDLLAQSPNEVNAYQSGKVALLEWFVGQAMRQAHGKANPNHLRVLIQQSMEKLGKNNQ
jgi:aspartyl-tRNA(Asn)/glutamyl-tRNA(Gln) amidotransferase subunit B